MDIKEVTHGERFLPDSRRLSISAVIGRDEFKQLAGDLENLRLFSVSSVSTESSIVKTGARNSHAKYFLFPSTLRKTLEASRYEMARIYCGVMEQGGDLFIMFGVPGKGRKELGITQHDDNEEEPLKTRK